MRALVRIVMSTASWFLVTIGAISVLALVLSMVLGIKFVTVLTPSMTASGIPAGSGVLVAPIDAPEIRPGDVILATSPSGDTVLHEAQSVPEEDEAGRLQLALNGTSNNSSADAYSYDVTHGAHKAFWSAPGLGRIVQLPWAPIPGTQQLFPGFAGVPCAAPFIFALLLWWLWPSRNSMTRKGHESTYELEAPAN